MFKLAESWGERGVFYNPNNKLKRGIYVLTIKEKDGVNDKASILDRENVFRVNLGIKKETTALGIRVEHPRIIEVVEPYPNQWPHHVIISTPQDLDEQVMACLRASYQFSLNKEKAKIMTCGPSPNAVYPNPSIKNVCFIMDIVTR